MFAASISFLAFFGLLHNLESLISDKRNVGAYCFQRSADFSASLSAKSSCFFEEQFLAFLALMIGLIFVIFWEGRGLCAGRMSGLQ